MTVQISPSILSADFSKLGEEIKAIQNAGAEYVHVDVMDGHFVPNITIGPLVIQSLKKLSPPKLDVHLMIENPNRYIEDFFKAGADIITVHQEACTHLHRTLTAIKDLGALTGVSINPATSVSSIEPVLELVDLVLIMSVNPGFGGQSFIEFSLQKIAQLNQLRQKKQYRFLIEVDGGINQKTAKLVKREGADILVAGSYIFQSENISEAITNLRKA